MILGGQHAENAAIGDHADGNRQIRPEAALKGLSDALNGRYLAMPFARAQEMSAAVSAALES